MLMETFGVLVFHRKRTRVNCSSRPKYGFKDTAG